MPKNKNWTYPKIMGKAQLVLISFLLIIARLQHEKIV